jgi:hypothetical protein
MTDYFALISQDYVVRDAGAAVCQTEPAEVSAI